MSKSDEGLMFSQCEIYYNYAFDLGGPTNPIDVARRLLRDNLGTAFRNYGTRQDEISANLEDFTDVYRRLIGAYEIIGGIKNDLSYKMAFKLLMIDYKLYGPQLAKSIWHKLTGKQNSEQVNNDEGDKQESNIEEVIQQAQHIFIDLVSERVLHEHVDRTVFHEDYLDKMPFVRVNLLPFTVSLGDRVFDFSVTALIHRSGVCILTSKCIVPRSVETDEIIKLERSSVLHIDNAQMPSSIYYRYARLLHGITQKQMTSMDDTYAVNGRPGYLQFKQVEEEVVLASIFDSYCYSITEAARGKRYRTWSYMNRHRRTSAWFCYPIVFITLSQISRENAPYFMKAHASSLAQLIIGLKSDSILSRIRSRKSWLMT